MSSPRRPGGRRHRRAGMEFLHGRHVIEAALSAGRRPLHRLLVRAGDGAGEPDPLVHLARRQGVPVETVDARVLRERAGGAESLQGLLLEAGPLPVVTDVAGLLGGEETGQGRQCLVALDGVEDPRNLGAIARVADAAGASGIVLTDRRSPPLGPVAARASAGALEWLPVCRIPNLSRALGALKRHGFWVIGADQGAERSLFEMSDRLLSGDVVVVLGAEGRGLRRSIRDAVDHPVRIPMAGRVASLNVAAAASVVLFELVRRSGADARAGRRSRPAEGATPPEPSGRADGGGVDTAT